MKKFWQSSNATASYSLLIRQSAEKELRAIPKRYLPKIIQRIQSLANNPGPPGHEKLSGREEYRVRLGDYRILYTINDALRQVEIMKIGHRREVYR